MRFCSEITPIKHETYTRVIVEVMRVNSLIFKENVWNTWDNPFVYWDLCAGYGREEDGRYGSPLIFLDTVIHHPDLAAQAKYLKEMKFVCKFIEYDEHNEGICLELDKNLKEFIQNNPELTSDQFRVEIIRGNYVDFLIQAIIKEEKNRYKPHVRGLVYADPSGEIVMAPNLRTGILEPAGLRELFQLGRFSKMDIFMNLPVNTIKRCRGVSKGGKVSGFKSKNYYLKNNIIDKLKKKYWSERLMYGAHEWVQFLGTNMPNLNEFWHAGFFDHRTEQGLALYYLSNFTKKERKERDLESFINEQDLDAEREELDKSMERMEREDI